MDKDSSEIVKLTERIAKDPKSKLFVPLAEEYKKAGDIGKAVSVLTEGLKNNPGYVTARSFLGRLLMESGDLAGAQKELEEVIKAIPDNLLAQRKLGDLYILRGKTDDALKRYKAALTLNPGDKEVTAFVADLEAGKDISTRIPKPKTVSSPTPSGAAKAAVPISAAPPKKEMPAAAAVTPPRPAAQSAAAPSKAGQPAAPQQAPARPVVTPTPIKEPQQTSRPVQAPASAASPIQPRQKEPSREPIPPVKPVGSPADAPPRAEAVVPPAQSRMGDAEAVEDIVELEPLEHLAAQAAVAAARQERKPPSRPQAHSVEEPVAGAFDLSEPSGEAIAFPEEPQPMEWAPPAEPAPELSAETKSEEPEDDINTDTLAELYISQSFYEKAIEIYERMLSERPGTAVLEQKLRKLRALAAAADKGGTSIPVPAAVSAGEPWAAPEEYKAPASFGEEEIPAAPAAPEAAAPVPPVEITPAPAEAAQEAVKSVPAGAAEAHPAASADDSLKAMQDALEGAERPKPPVMAPADADMVRSPQTATVRRKETIDRLETWLKNVMKEKPQ